MTLYHGSNMAFDLVDLSKGLPAKDFGRGFYTTDAMECAERTAKQRVARLGGKSRGYWFMMWKKAPWTDCR